MDLLQTIFYTLIALGVLVSFHEFGHFWVARLCDVKVERFSIGFGTALLKWRDRQNTEFVIAALPLGGYVKMLDERDTDVAEQDLPYAFGQKTVWQRMAIVIAGPMANFLLAIVAFWLVFLLGERDIAPVVGQVRADSLASQAGFEADMEIVAVNGVATATWGSVSRQLLNYIGSSDEIPFTVVYQDSELQYILTVPVENWLREIDQPAPLHELGVSPPFELQSLKLVAVLEDGAGYVAGLRAGDQVLSINGQAITSTQGFIDTVAGSYNRSVTLDIQRQTETADAELLTIDIEPRLVERDGRQVGAIGVQLASTGRYPDRLMRHVQYNVLTAIPRSIGETLDTSALIFKAIGKLVMGDLSSKSLSGPISIAKIAGDSAQSGIDNFIRFIAILSIMLGVMNLLPIPVLDGGHLMFYLIEVIKGSPVAEAVQMVGYKVGFAMLMGLMVFATYNDVTRLF